MTCKGGIDYEPKDPKKKRSKVKISGKGIKPEVWEDFERALKKMAEEQYGIKVTIEKGGGGGKGGSGPGGSGGKSSGAKKKVARKQARNK